jgi:hypothetical protein
LGIHLMLYNQPYDQPSNPDASYVNGNPSSGIQGSIIPAGAMEQPQRELIGLITAAGLTPSNSDLSQVAKAIQGGVISFAVAGGSANALTATLNPVPPALVTGMRFWLKIGSTNTGAATLNLNGLGITAITRADGSPLQSADLQAGALVWFAFDGTNFQIVGLSTSFLPGRNITSYSTAGTYTFVVPAGVYKIYCICVGAGGGAAGQGQRSDASAKAGGGGGAAGTALGWINVTPGQIITIIVGAAGVGGAPSANAPSSDGANGSTGSTSSIGAFMSATGGAGGSGSDCSGGAGGTGVGGQINQNGGAGTDGSGATNLNSYGGVGGVSSQGGGGRPSTVSSTIQNGASPGSGGASNYYNGWASNKKGGDGAPGIVILLY